MPGTSAAEPPTTRARAVGPPGTVAPFAGRPVLGLAALVAVVLAVCARCYGYFGDELYFIAAGRYASWGYVDQPPVLPLLAAGLDRLAPGSTLVLRLPAVLATAASVVVAALLARELGGRSRAQLTAAAAVAVCFFLLGSGRVLATSTLDPFFWTILLWLVVRWVRTDHEGRDREAADRSLLIAGVLLGVALNTKFLVLGLVAGLAVGVLTLGPRRLLGRPLLWAGLAVAALAVTPTVVWQAVHGWPQLRMGAAVAGEAQRWQFVPVTLIFVGLLPGSVLLTIGLAALLRRPELAPWRFLGVTVLITTAAFIIVGGRPYYAAGFYSLLFAAGAVALQDRPQRRWWRWTTGPVCFVLTGLLTAVIVLPPGGPLTYYDQTDLGQVRWPERVAAVARTYHALPPDRRGVVIAGDYWTAGALARGRTEAGLPGVYSPDRGYGYLAVPPGQEPSLLVGRFGQGTSFCSDLTPLPPYVAADSAPPMSTIPMALCLPRAPWAQLWPGVRTMG